MARKQIQHIGRVQDWPGYQQCEWNTDGERCRYAGTMSHSTGPGNWLCRHHWSCRDAIEGTTIVAASQDYQHQTQAEREKEHHAQAERYCNNLGLDTLEKRKAWLHAKWPAMAAYDTRKAPREPGEDWDEPPT